MSGGALVLRVIHTMQAGILGASMVGPEVEQRLAAILAADVVGYTRLMADDEPATIATITAYRGVWGEHIEARGGRVVDMAGDSVLAVFPSAAGAVQAADPKIEFVGGFMCGLGHPDDET